MNRFFLSVCMLLFLASTGVAQESSLENADGNSDGKVTVKEFVEYASEKLQGFDQLKEFAKKVDADGDGEISGKEFEGRMEILQSMMRGGEESEKQKSADKKQKAEKTNKKKVQDKSVVEAYEKLKKHFKSSDLKKAANMMTKAAQDQFAAEQFMTAKSMLEMDMPMQMPGFDEVLDNLEDVFEKHDLDDIEFDIEGMMRFEMSVDGLDEDEDEGEDKADKKDKDKSDGKKAKSKSDVEKNAAKSLESQMKKAYAPVLKGLDKKGKRWEIVSDLWNAQKGSPFQMSPLTGNVEDHEVEGKLAYVRVKIVPPQMDDESGMMMQIMSPPMYLKMEKEAGSWKYAGLDMKRTQKAMEEFMKNQPGLMVPGDEMDDDDF